mmetsp:Transcript_20178/g.55649  ORF Transcript_20178/g.55649 Transcript_20178/m.55649 type:complete len:277 (+) Transcript_20178:239-1069(+)
MALPCQATAALGLVATTWSCSLASAGGKPPSTTMTHSGLGVLGAVGQRQPPPLSSAKLAVTAAANSRSASSRRELLRPASPRARQRSRHSGVPMRASANEFGGAVAASVARQCMGLRDRLPGGPGVHGALGIFASGAEQRTRGSGLFARRRRQGPAATPATAAVAAPWGEQHVALGPGLLRLSRRRGERQTAVPASAGVCTGLATVPLNTAWPSAEGPAKRPRTGVLLRRRHRCSRAWAPGLRSHCSGEHGAVVDCAAAAPDGLLPYATTLARSVA